MSAQPASLQLNADGTAFDVTPGQQGTGIDVTDIVKEAKNVLESFGKQTAQMVTLKNKVTDPVITDDQANNAKASADAWIAKPVAIKIGDHRSGGIRLRSPLHRPSRLDRIVRSSAIIKPEMAL